jgi:acetyl-CoA carboxylase, biotin carboxylase subunit
MSRTPIRDGIRFSDKPNDIRKPKPLGNPQAGSQLMFKKVLIANRGEIALRVLRACKELGIDTVAVHSTADANAMHVRLADESVCIGPPPIKDSYLHIPSIVAACEITGADAVHPGYGFLSENPRFARILESHKIAFIGPSARHIEMMGDKIEAKRTALELGIPCVPGSEDSVTSETEAKRIAAEIGYPVLIKPSAGGGGRGMKIAMSEAEMSIAFATARTESQAAFGDDTVYIEKYLAKPRHIEVQVIGDGKGKAIHLGTRDCSLQRRHQKVLEEAPAPTISAARQKEIGEICSKAIQKLGYSGAGTIEFLYENDEFHFIEMNTRLQVEHPVTECIANMDIVYEQIRVAGGEKLSLTQRQIHNFGHAIEVRINAEDAETFVPSPGTITYYHPAGGVGVRVDSSVYQGYKIPPYYDSLIGKLIVHGRTREECLMRLRRALDEFIVDGIKTTLPLFRRLIDEPDIQTGNYDIHWLEAYLGNGK